MKEYKIEYPDLGNANNLVLSTSPFGKTKIIYNGEEIKTTGKIYSFTNNEDKKFEITLKNQILDILPLVFINKEKVEIASPLKIHENILIGLPLLLIFIGGIIGAVLGILGTKVNGLIFRGDRSSTLKSLLSLLVAGVALGIYAIIALAIGMMINPEL